MKLVAATRILDEEDIVEAFVRHTAHYCQAHIFLDNGSHDRTLEILSSLRQEGFDITVFQNRSVVYSEEDFNTFLYRKACDLGADWVAFLDADEFIDDRAIEGGFVENLAALARDDVRRVCISVPLVPYEATSRDEPGERNVALRMVRHHLKSTIYKVIVKNAGDIKRVVISSGSHTAYRNGNELEAFIHPDLVYAHYSERSGYIWVRKFVKGWAKILASHPEVARRQFSIHYKGPYEILLRDPKSILENPSLMRFKNDRPELIEDPIHYKGGDLRYSTDWDDKHHAIASLLHYLDDLAAHHSTLLAKAPQAMKLTEQMASAITPIIGG